MGNLVLAFQLLLLALNEAIQLPVFILQFGELFC